MYKTVATVTWDIFTTAGTQAVGAERINVSDKVLMQAQIGFHSWVETTNKNHLPGMGTKFVKKCLVSVNICPGVALLGVVVPIGKRRNKTGKVLHRNAEVFLIVNRINPAHSHKLIVCDPFEYHTPAQARLP
jgi:hypothetical protein